MLHCIGWLFACLVASLMCCEVAFPIFGMIFIRRSLGFLDCWRISDTTDFVFVEQWDACQWLHSIVFLLLYFRHQIGIVSRQT